MALCLILFAYQDASIKLEHADRLPAAAYAVSRGEEKIADFSTALVKPSWKKALAPPAEPPPAYATDAAPCWPA